MSKKYDVMVAGHLCLDIIPRFTGIGATKIEELMRPGKLINVGEAIISTGGAVSNAGLIMKKLGNNVCFCACVGDDRFGKLTIEMLRQSGNADGIRVLQGESSSYTVVLTPPGIDRILLHNPGTNNRFSSSELNRELISQCRHFHFGYLPLMEKMFADEGLELQKVFQLAKDAGATTSCDMTLPDPGSASGRAPWKKILGRVLPYVDIFVPSIEEAFYAIYPETFLRMKTEHNNAELIAHLEPADYTKLADELLSMGCKMTTLKSGARGFYMKTGTKEAFASMGVDCPADYANWSGRELWAPAFTVEEFGSAAGSGDSSIAGLLSAFLRGFSIEKALKYATCCGLQNIKALDTVSGIKTWAETTAMLQKKIPMLDARVDAKGWKWSDEHGLWAGPNDSLSQSHPTGWQ
jgi:sugar/nucleoside kinase (ribokinase family)